jgi:hypothetical protein
MRRRLSVPLSVALHAAAFYAIGLVPWAASEIPEPQPPQREVFWLDQALPIPAAKSLDPADTASARTEPASEPAPEPTPAPERTESPAPQPLTRAPPPSPPPREVPAAPSASPIAATAPVPVADERSPTAPAPESPAPPPEVDWEKERHDAVRDVLEGRATQREYLTFSIDDLVEEPKPVDPLPLPLVVDNCVIVKGRLARFAALMMGRCVREARADLFAAIKPAYLKARPVCIETRPDNPGSFLSDGREISTVKCELVAVDDE